MEGYRVDIQPALTPDLQYVCDEFVLARNRVEAGFGHLDDNLINRSPAPNRWSIALCLEHLCVTAEAYFPEIDAATARAAAGNIRATGPFRYSLLSRLMESHLGTIPPKFKSNAPAVFQPVAPHGADEIRARFAHIQDELIGRARRANGFDLQRVKMQSPVARLVRLPLGMAFRTLAAHQRRHLWQAEQVLRDLAIGP